MAIYIRNWQHADTPHLFELFLQTVRQVNIRDYSAQQVAAWASDSLTLADWHSRMQAIQPFVACIDDQIVGYADVQSDGLIDHFFCHHDYQGKGVGQALMQRLHDEAKSLAISALHAHVSITARPFFERWGFSLMTEQNVVIRGVTLKNFLMQKRLVD